MLNEKFEFLIVLVEFLMNQLFEGYIQDLYINLLSTIGFKISWRSSSMNPGPQKNPKDHKITIWHDMIMKHNLRFKTSFCLLNI